MKLTKGSRAPMSSPRGANPVQYCSVVLGDIRKKPGRIHAGPTCGHGAQSYLVRTVAGCSGHPPEGSGQNWEPVERGVE
jgi:hypothetical protein